MKNKKYAYVGVGCVAIIVVVLIAVQSFSSKSEIIQPIQSVTHTQEATVDDGTVHEYDYTQAPDHIGEKATITGTVVKVFASKSGTTFLDFCKNGSSCPFSAVIFSGDLAAFGDVTKLQRKVSLTGIVKSYQNSAEMVLNDPTQVE